MSNIHLTTTQATHEDVNNMVSCRDAVFRTRGKRLFTVYLIAFLIAGLIFGVAYGFRDYIFDFIESTFGITLVKDSANEASAPEEKMNISLISNTSSSVTWHDINNLYFDGEYKFKYSYDKDQPFGIEGTFPDSRLKNKITYKLVSSSGSEITLNTVDGMTYIPKATKAGRYTLTAYIPETYISNVEAYNELYVTTVIVIEKSVVDLCDAYFVFDDGAVTYDTNEHTFSWRGITINGETVTEIPGDINLTYNIYDNVAEKYINDTSLTYAGEYKITGKFKPDNSVNYEFKGDILKEGNISYYTFSDTVFIQKKEISGLTVEAPDNFVYDGKTLAEVKVKGLPKGHYNFTVTYMAYFLNDDNKTLVDGGSKLNEIKEEKYDELKYTKTTNEFVSSYIKDAAKYSFTVDLGRNFTTKDSLTGEFTIYKANLDISDVEYVYYYYTTEKKNYYNIKGDLEKTMLDLIQFEGTGTPTYDGKYYFYAAKVSTIPTGVSVDYVGTKRTNADKNYIYSSSLLEMLAKNEFEDNSPGKNEIAEYLKMGLTNAGIYDFEVTFSGRNYITTTDDELFTINKATIYGVTLDPQTYVYEEGTNRVLAINGTAPSGSVINKSTVYTDKKNTTYTLNGFVPQTLAGSYKYIATIENENYNTLDLAAYLTIEKASFNLPDFEEDWHFKNGKTLFAPDSSKYDLPYDTKVELKSGDKDIKGVSKLGEYTLMMVFTNDNYHTHTITVNYRIVFNPLIIIFCLVVGLLLAIILLVIVLPLRRRKDRISRENLIALRTQLSHERNGIICESYAKSRDKFSKKKGRLYLTSKALEFYDRNYPMNYKNFTILPKDILDVKDYGLYNTKLAIASRSGWRKIKVPAGTAKIWKKEIIHFKNMQQAYYSELHIINPKSPRP